MVNDGRVAGSIEGQMKIKNFVICCLIAAGCFLLMKTDSPPRPDTQIYYVTAGVFVGCLLFNLTWSD